MVIREIRIRNRHGLHLRPASAVCEIALKYRCRSELVVGNKTYNLKSVLSVLSAQVTAQGLILIRCDGADEADAMEALAGALTAAGPDTENG